MANPRKDTPGLKGINEPGAEQAIGERSTLSESHSIQTEPPNRIGSVDHVSDHPDIGAFCRQHGASPLGIDSASIVEALEGYPKCVGRYKFGSHGVQAFGGAPEPTDAEQDALKKAWAGITLPELAPLVAIADSPPGVDLRSDNIFLCHDFEDRIIMIHQRYDTENGGKGFVPWTYWSDAKWRKLEPEILPFFGMVGHRNNSILYIHEGAKAARAVARSIEHEDNQKLPWVDDLHFAHHIGWIGGVNAVDRSDWAKLAKQDWTTVNIVADNDLDGIRAARQIAGYFSCKVRIIIFDERWPLSFDLADDWPAEFWDDRGCYIGPSVTDCRRPATRATQIIATGEQGRPTAVLTRQFEAEVAYTISPSRFIFRDQPSRDLSEDEFNAQVAPFSDVKNTTAKIVNKLSCQHDRLEYYPPGTSGTITLEGERCWNSYEPPYLLPIDGDLNPWLDFLNHLFPVADEREQACDWLATLMSKPDIRMRYGMLLISKEQGVGKNTLFNTIAAIIGRHNVSIPSERSVTDSQFNGWCSRKRLIFIAEIYSGASRAAYDKMKPLITDDWIEINEKNVKPYTLRNWATVIACSNSPAALYLDDEDRRWFVPAVAEQQKPTDWWNDYYAWLEGNGAAVILKWAKSRVADGKLVNTGDRAPGSSRKAEIVEASRSEGQNLVIDLAENLIERKPTKVILRMRDIRQWVADKRGFQDIGHRRLEQVKTLIGAIRKVEGITVWADKMRPKINGTREAVVMNFEPGLEQHWTDIKAHLTDIERIDLDDPM
jgi:Family of unknown function (DUF5906)